VDPAHHFTGAEVLVKRARRTGSIQRDKVRRSNPVILAVSTLFMPVRK
jgi:hypothetical protein